jgi:hypothetical protein
MGQLVALHNGISVYEFQLELGRRLARRIKVSAHPSLYFPLASFNFKLQRVKLQRFTLQRFKRQLF